MHETQAELDALQDLLDTSYANAGKHLLSIHTPDWRMSAADLSQTLTRVCVLDLATVSKTGNPYVAPVDGLFLHGRFWFSSSHESQRFRHIRSNCRVSAAHTRGEEISVVVHGSAVEVDVGAGGYDELYQYCREIYDDFDAWGTWGEQPYAYIEPEKMYAIRISLE